MYNEKINKKIIIFKHLSIYFDVLIFFISTWRKRKKDREEKSILHIHQNNEKKIDQSFFIDKIRKIVSLHMLYLKNKKNSSFGVSSIVLHGFFDKEIRWDQGRNLNSYI